ncbi:TetR family transcriptional regulator [Ornithinibacillus halotolerans]|uniref:TetR family transcriptional regulator n=1 Tax=Ornithinibacillus halotolerans TaxID=1274357 RepID=A0A916RXM4_9BACI|nr:TetR/AcrR family transcriptional regulator [Ornithinibacillus halotolerans]GGA71849.1 TetR family transcriptional regulator [Ornithinibacillus halotolerans]
MESNKNTQRKQRTAEHLQYALIALIKEKGFHSVTVKNIVDYAKYNRSTFYIHYQDKYELAEDLLDTMLLGLEYSIQKSYQTKRIVDTSNLNEQSFSIISYIYENRNFFELIKYSDTLPDLHTKFPQTILKIYQEKFVFETIENKPVNMDFFTRYTAYGFYGLVSNWINSEFKQSQEAFIQDIIQLAQTHMATVRYIG